METENNTEAAGFRELADALPMMIWTATPDGRVDFSNQAFSDYTGVAQAAPPETRWQDTLHPDDIEPTLEVWTKCVGDKIPYSVEFRIRRADGVYRWFHCQAKPVPDAAGKLVKWYGTAVDIEDLRREQQELRLLRSSIAKSEDVVLITEAAPLDEPGPRIVFVNEAFERTLGYTPNEALGRSPRFLQGDDTSREALDRIRLALHQAKPIREELLNYDKQGNPHWLEIAIEPVTNGNGRLTHFVSVQREISDRKKAEQERTGLIHDLRERVKELKAMHEIATLLRQHDMQKQPLITAVAKIIAEGMRWPEHCAVLVACDGVQTTSPGYRETEFRLESKMRMAGGQKSLVRVVYTSLPDAADIEDPFLGEERELVRWVTETLCSHFERLATEDALRASEERFRLLADVTNDAIWDWDFASGELWWNEGFEKLFGYDRKQERPGPESWTDHIHPDDREWVVGSVKQAIESGERDWSADYRFLHRDGHVVRVLERGRVIRDSSGKAVRMIGGTTDITQLVQLREQYNQILNSAGEGIHGLDAHGKILFENPAGASMLGWPAGELVGCHAHNKIHHHRANGSEYPAEECPIHRTLRDGRPRRVEDEVFFDKNGRPIPVKYSCAPMRGAAGEIIGVVVCFSDVTEHKRLEAQLLRAQRMESIGTLAGGIAHDLNNVLAPIIMSVDLIKQQTEDAQTVKLLDSIHSSARRGARMISQVLSFARGFEGRKMEVKAAGLISELEGIVRETFPKNITLTVQITPEVQTLHADPTQIHQVILNLLVNSRDAMPEGGKLLLAVAQTDLDAAFVDRNMDATQGPHVLITVEDTGCGMDKQVLERLFDPFFTTKEHGKGTGLGMPTSLSIVKSHGGFMRVYSEPGSGTSVRVYLPATRTGRVTGSAPSDPRELMLGDGELVLIVEDEAAILELARQTLEAHGYRALTAENPASALALAETHRDEIKLIVTDIMLPGMGADQMILRIRALLPNIRVVATSGFSAQNAGTGADAFLPKPYTTRDLLHTMRRVIDRTNAKKHSDY